MKLHILTPTRALPVQEARELVAETDQGSVGILPRHIDYVAPLVPGILLWESPGGEEHCMAVDRGTLVKCGSDVFVSVREAVEGEDLASLREAVRGRFEVVDERERMSRSALAHLEARFLRALLEERSHGA